MAKNENAPKKESVTERELLELYKARLKDRKQSRTKRRKQLESHPQSASEIIKSYFKNSPEALRKIEESRALMAWPEIVGASAARVSEAVRIRGHQLVVRVTDPIWMQQLSLLKNELLKKYRQLLPHVSLRDIFFTANPMR